MQKQCDQQFSKYCTIDFLKNLKYIIIIFKNINIISWKITVMTMYVRNIIISPHDIFSTLCYNVYPILSIGSTHSLFLDSFGEKS